MTTDDDAYKRLLCSVLELVASDAVEETKERAWLYSRDAHILCDMADIDYPRFRDEVIKKISLHDNPKRA